MVKGISRQVIVVNNPEQAIFDQAIFILKEDAVNPGVTQEQLMKEAQKLLRSGTSPERKRPLSMYGPVWAFGGAGVMALVWFITGLV